VQVLEAELLSREPVVQTLVGRAQRMIHSGHFAGSRIEACSTELTEKMGHLRNLASLLHLRLLDAVESQMVSASWSFWNF
jgi:spectrin beta